MASTGLPLILRVLLIHLASASSDVFVKIECKGNQVAVVGQDSLLECVLVTSHEVEQLEIKSVTWTRYPCDQSDPPALSFRAGNTSSGRGYSFAEPRWDNKTKNVSLLISEAAVQHEGFYECVVETSVGSPKPDKLISFNVTAKYTKPTVEFFAKGSKNEEGILECRSLGYPHGRLRWFDEDDNDWSTSATMVSTKVKSGLIELTSRLTLLKGSIFNFTCAVFNATGHRGDHSALLNSQQIRGSRPSAEPEPEPPQRQAIQIAAPLVVIGSLLVALLLAVTYKLYCKRRRPEKPISRSDVEEGENESLNLET